MGNVRYSLDARNNSYSGFSGEFSKSLELKAAADSRNVCEHLQAFGEGLCVAVVEQNYRRHVFNAWDDGRRNVSLCVIVVGGVECNGLRFVGY